jgi:hypothetical protein
MVSVLFVSIRDVPTAVSSAKRYYDKCNMALCRISRLSEMAVIKAACEKGLELSAVLSLYTLATHVTSPCIRYRLILHPPLLSDSLPSLL